LTTHTLAYGLSVAVHAAAKLESRYQLVLTRLTWSLAQKHCQTQYKAKLVVIASEIEHLALKAYLDTINQGLAFMPFASFCVSIYLFFFYFFT